MVDTSIKVIDKFLPDECFRYLAFNLMTIDSYRCHDFTVDDFEADGSIDWYGERNTNNLPVKMHEILMVSQIYVRNHNRELIQDIYHLLRSYFEVLYKTLNVKKMLLIRTNCTHAASENFISDWHTDLGDHPDKGKSKTCILYLNRNNGGTKFKESGEFVQSEPNRAVIFNGTTEHAGVWCTDKKLRFVLNINYTEKT
tara:strand:+ start:55 stop:648 length:594 start_codon:yes stop_codon:yes gene_type:complete